MCFLTGADIQTQVRMIASRDGDVMAAVAYWGRGAAERTGLTEHHRPDNVRIICDLLSGACNPAEIETLLQLGLRVRTLDRLHAKVWIGEDHVVVGSANASQNGLLGEGEQAANANVEAAVLSHDLDLARDLMAWFEAQWDPGLPISIGIAETKTLAKIANRLAKTSAKTDGVLDLTGERWRDRALASTEVGDVWGIGRQYAKKLNRNGVMTALDLARRPDGWIRKEMGVGGLKTVSRPMRRAPFARPISSQPR